MFQTISVVCGPVVRRTSATSAVIWLELDRDAIVNAWAVPLRGPAPPGPRARRPPTAVSRAEFTVKVGGRFYVLLTLEGLAPGWVYAYEIYYRPNEGRRNPALWPRDPRAGQWWNFNAELRPRALEGHRPTFRTFPAPSTEDVRIAFGSCRVFGGGFFGGSGVKGEDVFTLYGRHLRSTVRDREASWPHLLLLLGDQIYADNVDRKVATERLRAPGRAGKVLGNLGAPESILKWERDRRPGETKTLFRQRIFGKDVELNIPDLQDYAGWGDFQCLEFADYAALYTAAWTEAEAARVLANLPTFMIFDDHEVANDWNLTGGWLEQVKRSKAWVRAITDGLVGYWMYQGWGNPLPPGSVDSRWTILEQAALDGTDALEALRQWFAGRLALGRAAYYYEIPISPPVLVLDTRNDRSFASPKRRGPNGVSVHADADDDILSEEQWRWLRGRIDQKGPLVIACGVPLLQLLCADVWLLRGTRSVDAFLSGIEERSQEFADVYEYYRRYIGTDQWTAFPKSFGKLTRELFDKGPFVFLSGDVHYSYAHYGRTAFPSACKLGRDPMILHAVSSPLRSQWTAAEAKTNNPEQCPGLGTPRTLVDNVRARIAQAAAAGAAKPCELLKDAANLRVFFPDVVPAFTGTGKKEWTYLNNLGILELPKDGRSVGVRWLGASTKKGEALHEIGAFSARGTFVR